MEHFLDTDFWSEKKITKLGGIVIYEKKAID